MAAGRSSTRTRTPPSSTFSPRSVPVTAPPSPSTIPATASQRPAKHMTTLGDSWLRGLSLLLLVSFSIVGCAAPTAQPSGQAAAPAQSGAQARTLIMVVNTEVANLARKMIGPTNPERTTRVFNADLAIIDNRGEPRPYLAAELPRLNTDSWRVSPDGRMETTWKLRPGL